MKLLFGLLLAALLRGADQQSCNPACASGEVCVTAQNTTACQCNSVLYQNATYADLVPSVDCGGSKIIVYVGKCLLDKLRNDPASTHLTDVNCTRANTTVLNNIKVYSMETEPKNASCGNMMVVNSTHVTYSNTMYIPPLLLSGIISSKPVNFNFSCTYKLNMQTSLATVLRPIQSTLDLSLGGNGTATTTIAAYSNPSYTSPIQMGGQEMPPMGSTIYFGMSTEFADISVFVLRVETCFATPTENPNNPNKIYLIQNGCPIDGDVYTTVVENGQSLQVRFSVESFAFQETSEAYIYCDARLCDKSESDCRGSCPSGSRSGDVKSGLQRFALGPFYFSGEIGDLNSGSHTVVSWVVLGASLLALLSLRLM